MRIKYKDMKPNHNIHEVSIRYYLEKHSNYEGFGQTEILPPQ